MIKQIKNNDKKLIEISIPFQYLGDENIKVIVEELHNNPYITSLDFRANNLTDSGIEAIAKALKDNKKISALKIGLNELSPQGALTLANLLSSNNTLQILQLGHFSPGSSYYFKKYIGKEGTTALAMALKDNDSLLSLDLSNQQLNTEDVSILFDILTQNHSLKTLHLEDNNIDNNITESLCNLINFNNKLEELFLDFYPFSEHSIYQINEALSNNNSLRILNISYRNINDKIKTVNMREVNILQLIREEEQEELTPYEFPICFSIPNHIILERFTSVMTEYQNIANSNPDRLRELLPPQEIWRFFIERSVQENGRGLQNDNFFEELKKKKRYFFQKDILSYTIEKYITDVEKLSLDEFVFIQSKILSLLTRFNWQLNENEFEKYKLKDFKILDKAWMPFEKNEPGYLRSLYLAFHAIFKNDQEINIEFINELHSIALSGVHNTNYQLNSNNDISAIRSNNREAFGLDPGTMTLDGIIQILAQEKPYLYLQLEYGKFNIPVTLETVKFFKENISNFDEFSKFVDENSSDSHRKFFNYLYPLTNPKKAKLILTQLCKLPNDVEEIAKFIMSRHGHCGISVVCYFKDNVSETISNLIRQSIISFQSELNDENPFHRLISIIKFVQFLEQLHPYFDGNCRTICMLVLNFLLKTNGFPLAILDDANRFDAYSTSELLVEVVQGMENTLHLIKHKELFNINTTKILAELQHHHRDEELNYFNALIEEEMQARLIIQPPGII